MNDLPNPLTWQEREPREMSVVLDSRVRVRHASVHQALGVLDREVLYLINRQVADAERGLKEDSVFVDTLYGRVADQLDLDLGEVAPVGRDDTSRHALSALLFFHFRLPFPKVSHEPRPQH